MNKTTFGKLEQVRGQLDNIEVVFDLLTDMLWEVKELGDEEREACVACATLGLMLEKFLQDSVAKLGEVQKEVLKENPLLMEREETSLALIST